jgi:hypothetical protein
LTEWGGLQNNGAGPRSRVTWAASYLDQEEKLKMFSQKSKAYELVPKKQIKAYEFWTFSLNTSRTKHKKCLSSL